ncbi:MAG: prepilin-type N-terminal cleavage/methylation domain-containing protein [Candidatus Latescibacterota bacterium]|nr:MAG: prepilin-type N-terminal cleavage/methylation domain-containing protein [Candidatus Latescibacterota bacterium]
MKTRRRAARGGFSLIEMVIAMALLGFALLAMGRLFLASSEHAKEGRHDMIALNAANEILERMHAVDFTDVKGLFDGVDTVEESTVPAEARHWADHLAEHLGPTARSTIQVFDLNDDAELPNGLLEVDIRTSWTERGRERTMRTSTYIVRMGS